MCLVDTKMVLMVDGGHIQSQKINIANAKIRIKHSVYLFALGIIRILDHKIDHTVCQFIGLKWFSMDLRFWM